MGSVGAPGAVGRQRQRGRSHARRNYTRTRTHEDQHELVEQRVKRPYPIQRKGCGNGRQGEEHEGVQCCW